MNSNIEIGKRIKQLRENKGLTQKELAEKLTVKRETVNQWENGTRDLKTEYTIKLANFFEVTCDEILRGVKAENVSINKDLGLSDSAIEILNILKSMNIDDVLNVINFLIETLYFELKHEDIEIEENSSLLFAIYLYLTLQNENNFEFSLTYNGNISINGAVLGTNNNKTHYLDLLPTTVTIDKNSIIDNVLFTRVQEALKRSKEDYFKEFLKEREENADNNPEEE